MGHRHQLRTTCTWAMVLRHRWNGRRPTPGHGLAAAAAAAAAVGVALGLVAAGATAGVAPGLAGAGVPPTSAVTIVAQPTSGPVGTDIEMSGSVPPQCQGSMTISLSHTAGTPAVILATSTAALGEWGSSLVVPPVAAATVNGPGTQIGPAAQIGPGTWTLRAAPAATAPGCAPATTTFTVTGFEQVTSRFVAMAATPDGRGYWLAQGTGGVYSYGDAPFEGSLPGLGVTPSAPVVGMAATPAGRGYWLVGADGGVFAFGDAGFYGSLRSLGVEHAGPVVGIAATPDGKGYWLIAAGGGVYAFGDARFYGAARTGTGGGASALLASPGGTGYVVTYDQPGIFTALGSASAPADTGPPHITSVLVGAAAVPGGGGLWEVGTDGSVLAYGGAPFLGTPSTLGVVPSGPITAIVATPAGKGYWLLSSRGGVYAFGDAGFFGAAG